MIVVYRALNKSSGKSYIGWTVNFRRRRATHFRDSRKGSNCAFHNALRKHGKNVFVWKILGEYETEEAAKTAEIQMIQRRKIFQLRAEGWLLRELSNRFAISIARVSKILSDISGRYE